MNKQTRPAAAVAQGDDKFEVRADGKRVRVDRWEVAIRRIVALLWGNRHEFEVDDVVEAVRALVPSPNEDDEALVQAVLAGNYLGAPNGLAPAAPVAQPLTDGQLREVLKECAESIDSFNIVTTHWKIIARAVERAHGIGQGADDA